MKKIIFVFTFVFALLAGSAVVYREGTLPVNREDTSPLTFIVRKGDSVNTIINNLAMERLIRNRIVTYLIIKQMGIDKKIQAGSFKLNRAMDNFEVTKALTKATDDVWVSVREGLRKEEVADIFAKDLPSFVASEFINKADEGYLFPDTYLVPKSADADFMIRLMKNTFRDRLTNEMIAKYKALKLTEKEFVTLASLVEREAVGTQDRQPIASILLRRLQLPMRLQVDATIQYALGYQTDLKSWWKNPLFFEDLEIDSAYNTYKRDGLPKGPIASPGLASLQAVADADPTTPYLFYIHSPDRKAYFATTLDEHNANVEQYLDRK